MKAGARLPELAAWVMAGLLVAGTFAAGSAQAQASPAATDASITAQVQGALSKDPVLGAMDIKVQTQHGVVSLSGFVRTIEDIAKAGEVARGVSGVSGVRNDLRVANQPSRASRTMRCSPAGASPSCTAA
jgi:osmotically-inducible protein OsmY